MFETMMKSNGYRVDYINREAFFAPDAVALYVRGNREDMDAYSRDAFRNLKGGLAVISLLMNPHKLAAVYMDIGPLRNLARPAYQQMKADLRDGLFRRVVVFRSEDLMGTPEADDDLRFLHQLTGGFDLISYNEENGNVEYLMQAPVVRASVVLRHVPFPTYM